MSQEPSIFDAADSSRELVQSVRDHQPSAFHDLVHAYAPMVYGRALRWGLSLDAADDICQEVFLSVHRSLDTFNRCGNGSFRAWLRRITVNKIHDHQRQQTRTPLVGTPPGGTTALQALQNVASPQTLSESQEDLDDLAVLQRLAIENVKQAHDAKVWEIAWAAIGSDAPAKQLAGEFGVPAHQVYVYKSRVIREIREEFNRLQSLHRSLCETTETV